MIWTLGFGDYLLKYSVFGKNAAFVISLVTEKGYLTIDCEEAAK